MLLSDFIVIICSCIVVESITELVIKSFILNKVKSFLMSKSVFLEYLLSCGYCFSYWVTLLVLILLSCFNHLPIILDSLLNYFFIFFIIQRGSNIIHGSIDRYFDTRKDIRYNFKEQ